MAAVSAAFDAVSMNESEEVPNTPVEPELRRRFGDLLGHDGLVTRLGEALGPNLAAGRKKVTRWFSGEREPPEEIWHLLEALEAMDRVQWPERWKNARLRDVVVGRPREK